VNGVWGRGIDVIGQGYLGKSVMERCEEERRKGGVGGDPVGSTDPEVSRNYAPCTILAFKRPLCANSGVKRQLCYLSWR